MEATVDFPVAMEPVRPIRSIFFFLWGGGGVFSGDFLSFLFLFFEREREREEGGGVKG
jgi:hypothetical protein